MPSLLDRACTLGALCSGFSCGRRPRCVRAGVDWATGWLTVNTRGGRQFLSGKTVGSASSGIAAVRQPPPCALSNEALPGLSLLCVYGGVGSLTTGSPRGHAFLGGVGSMGLGCLWIPCFLGWTWLNVQSGHRKCGCEVLLSVCVPCTQRSGVLAAMRAVLLWDDATEKVVFGTFGADPMPGFSRRG